MPHQCLQCGHIFPQGSSSLLKGCPECGGTRFFFASEPLSEGERKKLMARSNKDLKSLAQELLSRQLPGGRGEIEGGAEGIEEIEEGAGETDERAGEIEWIKTEAEPTEPEGRWSKLGLIESKAIKPEATKTGAMESEEEGPVETISIPQPGSYEVDVKSLLDKSPIIVQKDGTYLVHLPTVFEMGKKHT